MNVGPPELAIILVIILVLFGGAKLPKLARSLGQAQKEFRQGMSEGMVDDEQGKAGPDTSGPDTPGSDASESDPRRTD